MTAGPRLRVDAPSGPATAVALVLHGGRASGLGPARANQLAVLRMRPFAAALRRTGAERGVVVARLQYAVRGWNGERRSPVADATWALDRLGEQFPDRPVALVGHSMGGRTAFYAAGHDAVAAVVALAPWVEAGDPVEPLSNRRVLIAHGTSDRITNPSASEAYATRAAAVATSLSYVRVTDEGHAMLRRPRLWHELAAGFAVGALLPPPVDGPIDQSGVLAQALAGVPSLVV